MSNASLGAHLESIMKDARSAWTKLRYIQSHLDVADSVLTTWMPSSADAEYRELLRKSAQPYLAKTVESYANGLVVQAYSNDELYDKAWLANRMNGFQGSLVGEALGLGRTYVTVLPTDDDGVAMKHRSAHDTYVHFDDPDDDFPEYALIRLTERTSFFGGVKFWQGRWLYIDSEGYYKFKGTPNTPESVEYTKHDLGYTPVVEVQNVLGKTSSFVAKGVEAQGRIIDATFTIQMLQRYGAWPQKYMTGGDPLPQGSNASVATIVQAPGDKGEGVKFGTFQAADITGMLEAKKSHIQDLATLLSIPPHYLTSDNINLSAEAISTAESGFQRELESRKVSISEGLELAMRTAAHVLGMSDAANSLNDHFTYANVNSWSLAQITDAIVKLKSVGEDVSHLLVMLPGWKRAELEEAPVVAPVDPAAGLPPEDVGEMTATVVADAADAAQQDAATLAKKFEAVGQAVRAGFDPNDAARALGLDGIKHTGALPVSLRLPEDEANQLEAK